jgi:hypothetical protein
MLESPPRLAVYTSDAAFLLQPPGADWACLAVDRATGAVSLRGASPAATAHALITRSSDAAHAPLSRAAQAC